MRTRGGGRRSPAQRRWALGRGLAALACLTVLGTSCAAQDGGGADAAAPADPPASATPGPSSADPGAGSVQPVSTVVVTDDPEVAAAGASSPDTWPAALTALLGAADAPLDPVVTATPDAGFAGSAGPSFTDLVGQAVSAPTQLVVFYDTEVGSAAAPDVGEGAADAFAAVEQLAPDALVVVVAPWAAAADRPVPPADVRDALREAAAGAEVAVTWIDPAEQAWPVGASQQQVAELLAPALIPLVGALARSGARD